MNPVNRHFFGLCGVTAQKVPVADPQETVIAASTAVVTQSEYVPNPSFSSPEANAYSLAAFLSFADKAPLCQAYRLCFPLFRVWARHHCA